MPISRSEFEHREIGPELYVEQLLRSFADTAFSLDELLELAAREGRNFTREEVLSTLDALVKAGRAESAKVEGVVYYIYRRRPLGFRPSEG